MRQASWNLGAATFRSQPEGIALNLLVPASDKPERIFPNLSPTRFKYASSSTTGVHRIGFSRVAALEESLDSSPTFICPDSGAAPSTSSLNISLTSMVHIKSSCCFFTSTLLICFVASSYSQWKGDVPLLNSANGNLPFSEDQSNGTNWSKACCNSAKTLSISLFAYKSISCKTKSCAEIPRREGQTGSSCLWTISRICLSFSAFLMSRS
mmetsp:Transcript_37855/g.100764  ORF Transcript_37855/g.100764 Transcript_37855/m.100764 type:complete len:210 (+) Transcript_37855:1289-1918(+)